MAERRMFAKTIVDSDAFLDMPVTARLLYYDLGMRADDHGFVNSPKKIMRTIGASEDDLRILLARRFIIGFDNGVIVIKHWRINNYLRKDWHKDSPYQDELARLEVSENGAYTVKSADVFGDEPSPNRQRIGDESATNRQQIGDVISLDKLVKPNQYKENGQTAGRFAPPTVEQVREYTAEKGLAVNAEHFVDYYAARGWKLGKGQPMKDWQAAVRTWANLDKERKAEKCGAIIESFDPEKTAADALERSMREMLEAIGND